MRPHGAHERHVVRRQIRRSDWNLFAAAGVTTAFLKENRRGMAAVQQNITYRRELHAGETVAIRSAFLEVREKVAKFVHEMRNAVTGEISAICVLTGVHTDAQTRKSCPFPRRSSSAPQPGAPTSCPPEGGSGTSDPIVIVWPRATPMGAFQGELKDFPRPSSAPPPSAPRSSARRSVRDVQEVSWAACCPPARARRRRARRRSAPACRSARLHHGQQDVRLGHEGGDARARPDRLPAAADSSSPAAWNR